MEFGIDSYENFTSAQAEMKKVCDQVDADTEKIKESKQIIEDPGSFEGPICDVCKEKMDELMTDIESIKEKYEKMSTYLGEVSEGYRTGDESAMNAILDVGSSTGENPSVSYDGLSYDDFMSKVNSMDTPTKEEIIELGKSLGLSEEYMKTVIGTTEREGYSLVDEPYLYYGWASAMINQQKTIEQMQPWDPYHSGDANYYSAKNVQAGYDGASDIALKSVYLALTNRNTKIVGCYGGDSSSFNNCDILYTSKNGSETCYIFTQKS